MAQFGPDILDAHAPFGWVDQGPARDAGGTIAFANGDLDALGHVTVAGLDGSKAHSVLLETSFDPVEELDAYVQVYLNDVPSQHGPEAGLVELPLAEGATGCTLSLRAVNRGTARVTLREKLA